MIEALFTPHIHISKRHVLHFDLIQTASSHHHIFELSSCQNSVRCVFSQKKTRPLKYKFKCAFDAHVSKSVDLFVYTNIVWLCVCFVLLKERWEIKMAACIHTHPWYTEQYQTRSIYDTSIYLTLIRLIYSADSCTVDSSLQLWIFPLSNWKCTAVDRETCVAAPEVVKVVHREGLTSERHLLHIWWNWPQISMNILFVYFLHQL